MGGCLVLLIINLFVIINTARTGQSCPCGWPNGSMVSIAKYSFVFKILLILFVPDNLARTGDRMGGCLVLLSIDLLLIILNAGCAGQSCPGGLPDGRMFSIAKY